MAAIEPTLGEFVAAAVPGGVLIERADPVIWVSGRLIHQIEAAASPWAMVQRRDGEPDLLRIFGWPAGTYPDGEIREWVYCIAEWDTERDYYRCYWPD